MVATTPEVLQCPQQLQVSADGLALSFRSSFIGSGNSLYNSTSVSWNETIQSSEMISHCWLGFRTLASDLFEGIACNGLEGLLHVDRLLGAGFEIRDVVLALTPGLCSFGCYLKHKGADVNVTTLKRMLLVPPYLNPPVCSPSQSYCPKPQRGSSLDLEGWPGSRTHPASRPNSWRCLAP